MLPVSHPRGWTDPAPARRGSRWIFSAIILAVGPLLILCLLSFLRLAAQLQHVDRAYKQTYQATVTPSPRNEIVLNRSIPSSGSTSNTLLSDWCADVDKAATPDWANLTSTECMMAFLEKREAAVTAIRDDAPSAFLLFKHVHKAGGTTLCQLAKQNANMVAEDVPLPFRDDWTTNCVPYESFLGPHPAVGSSGGGGGGGSVNKFQPNFRRTLQGLWLGGACFLGFLTPAQLKVMPHHYRPLNFIASEGPLPDALPLDGNYAMMTMLRNPLDRVYSSYRWWQFMVTAMPHSPVECHAYWVPSSSTTTITFLEWVREYYPDNWVTRELAGLSALYKKDARGKAAPLTAAEVHRAKQRLHYFAALLIMERPEGSQLLLQQRFGWNEVDLAAHRAGSNVNSSASRELSPEVLMQLRELNKHDLEVFAYALELHEAQVQEAARRSSRK